MSQSGKTVWIETNVSSLDHGGAGWEYGQCLWSPSKSRNGSDIYSLMRACQKGDDVIHIRRLHGIPQFTGRSRIQKPCVERYDSPSNPGEWAGMAPYYRVELADHIELKSPLPISTFLKQYQAEIWDDMVKNKPRHFPFVRYRDELRLGQGLYLTRCTSALLSIFEDALEVEIAALVAETSPIDVHREYAEVKRAAREVSFFARNPTLVKRAKEHYGAICMACGFDFEKSFGSLGRGYCECHHIDPLSARSPADWTIEMMTSISGVAILCANCHRMVHRRTPPLTIDELKLLLIENREPRLQTGIVPKV